MANTQVVDRTRESVTLEWATVAPAIAYSVSREGPLGGPDPVPDFLLAVCYQGTYCDATLRPGSRYTYTIESIPAEGSPPDSVEREQISVRTLPETEYPDSRTWFEQFVRPTFRRNLDTGVLWCEQWWDHPEAVYVLEHLWRSYEALRTPEAPAPPGKQRAEWLVGYFYPLFDRLLLSKGPFEGCAVDDRQNDGLMHTPRTAPLIDGRAPTIAP